MATELLQSINKMDKDIKAAAATLSAQEVRFLVDAYYQMQEDRIRSAGRERALDASEEPNLVLGWLSSQSETLETQIKGALERYSKAHPVGEWAMKIKGIGPVITAGLLAHIDVHKANTAGKVWAYAGITPNSGKRKRGEKLNYNPMLKTLAWKIGESFVKVSGREGAYYGKVYVERKALEIERNETKAFADQAVAALEAKNYGKDTEAYKAYIEGKLPPAHIHARAKRYAAKLFLAHFHEMLYTHVHGCKPPLPYAISILGHADYIPPPQ